MVFNYILTALTEYSLRDFPPALWYMEFSIFGNVSCVLREEKVITICYLCYSDYLLSDYRHTSALPLYLQIV